MPEYRLVMKVLLLMRGSPTALLSRFIFQLFEYRS
jgi:hypothetical protein